MTLVTLGDIKPGQFGLGLCAVTAAIGLVLSGLVLRAAALYLLPRGAALPDGSVPVSMGSSRRMETVTMKIILASAVMAASFAFVPPATAQQRMLTIFGDDKCPSDTICVVGREEDRYRIPKFLREPTVKTPASQSWAVRQQATLSEGKSGTGSCSASGAGGWTGCWTEYMKKMRDEAAATKDQAPDIPR